MSAGKQPRLVQAVIARGRTVAGISWKEGDANKIEVPEDEVKFLRARGFLVDPDAKEIPRGNGPMFAPTDGPMVRVA